MTRALVLVAALGACGGWSKRDTALEVSSWAANLADAEMTTRVEAAGLESNPMLGRSGERMSLALYEPGVLLGHLLISAVLPRGWMRTTWQIGSTALEAIVVARGYSMGYAP